MYSLQIAKKHRRIIGIMLLLLGHTHARWKHDKTSAGFAIDKSVHCSSFNRIRYSPDIQSKRNIPIAFITYNHPKNWPPKNGGGEKKRGERRCKTNPVLVPTPDITVFVYILSENVWKKPNKNCFRGINVTNKKSVF